MALFSRAESKDWWRLLHNSGEPRAARTKVGESGHLGGVGPAHGFEGPLDRRSEVGLGPGDCAKDLAGTVNHLDIADAALQVAFAAFAAAYEGRIQADGDCRRSGRRFLRRLIDQLFTHP